MFGVPSQVENVRLSREVINRRPALNVSWDAPSGDQDIERYEVKYRRLGPGTVWRFVNITGSPPATSTNLQNLGIGAAFQVLVRAWSEAGPGKWSNATDQLTYGGEFAHGVFVCILYTHGVAIQTYVYKKVQ